MVKEKPTLINNPKLRDSSSKLIFGNNFLCSQFLRDYADMEILRHIQPEDIEDVSERYVPLYSTEGIYLKRTEKVCVMKDHLFPKLDTALL